MKGIDGYGEHSVFVGFKEQPKGFPVALLAVFDYPFVN